MSKFIKMTDEIAAGIRESVIAQVDKAIATDSKSHDGNITVTYSLGKSEERATLNISVKAYLKIQALVATFQKEVAWHGTAFREDEENHIYRIEDIVVYPQMVDGTNVNTDDGEYCAWNMGLDDDVAMNLRFHGHSHVNMAAFASYVDIKHQKEILGMMDDDMFYIFMITNKRGDMELKIYDMKQNILFETADITVSITQDDINIPEFIAGAKKLVKDLPYSYSGYYNVRYSGKQGTQTNGAQTAGNNKTCPTNKNTGGKKRSTIDDGFVVPNKKGPRNALDYLDEEDDDYDLYGSDIYTGYGR